MSQIAVNVAIEMDPAFKEEILRALLAHRERCLRDEPGTLRFEVLVPIEEPTKLFLFELYTDPSALEAHSSGASIVKYREEVNAKILKVTVHKCLLGHESPY